MKATPEFQRDGLRHAGQCVFMLVCAALISSRTGTAHGEETAAPLNLGDTLPRLEFKDVWYLPRTLADLGESKAYVVVFGTVDCPLTTALLPHLKQLDETYRTQGVRILLLNAGPEDSMRMVAHQGLEVEARFALGKDFDGTWARTLGASTTGQAFVFDHTQRLRYRGRVTDRYQFIGSAVLTRTEPGAHDDLRTAIDDLLAGRAVAQPETSPVGLPLAPPESLAPLSGVNFAQHVQPILARHCANCHHPGTEAPFSLVTYEDAAGHADMIAEVVREERMPPWYASFGHFLNAPTMSADERRQVRAWVAAGTPAGALETLPPVDNTPRPVTWAIDTPDLVLKVPQPHELPADGFIPYKYVILPYRFEHDTWIQQCEILPDNPRVVHHCNMAYLTNPFDPKSAKFVLGKVPGSQPMDLEQGVAFRIPKGANLVLQIHYTTNGQPEKCQISVGFRYAREVVQKEFQFLWMVNETFAIPPGDPLHKVTAINRIECNAQVIGMFAHMHVRGRDMSFFANTPDGQRERLLVIPNYSFDWQLAYRLHEPRRFPKGTVIECISHYDNSPFNPYNPDPTATVREGDQTVEEMLNGVMFFVDEDQQLNLRVDPATGAPLEGAPAARAPRAADGTADVARAGR